MQLFLKIVASGAEINYSTYSVLLKNLLAAGNWRKYIEVIFYLVIKLLIRISRPLFAAGAARK